MNYFLHFIGKSYYKTEKEFVNEALKNDISRAIAFNIFKKMNFGDIILLAQGDSKKSTIFGYFIFNNIFGLKKEVIQKLEKNNIVSKDESFSPISIDRGCGSYVITSSYSINNNEAFSFFVKTLEKEDFDRLMIGGKFYPISSLIPNKDKINTNIPFQQGFRLFDFDAFKQAVYEVSNNKVKGMFYKKEYEKLYEDENYFIDANLFIINNYQLN